MLVHHLGGGAPEWRFIQELKDSINTRTPRSASAIERGFIGVRSQKDHGKSIVSRRAAAVWMPSVSPQI
jgi:hypothetical protein